jgi:NOP5NT (NUC127) domain
LEFGLNFFFCKKLHFDSRKFAPPTTQQTKQSRSTMGVFVLTETSAGFALFKAKDSKIFKKGDVSADVETAEGINGL